MVNIDLVSKIARVCHEANRAWSMENGESNVFEEWDTVPDEIRQSSIEGVLFAINNPDVTPEDQHNAWMRTKLHDGWVYGPEKSLEKKTHPLLVDYSELSDFQKTKDYLFRAIVKSLYTEED